MYEISTTSEQKQISQGPFKEVTILQDPSNCDILQQKIRSDEYWQIRAAWKDRRIVKSFVDSLTIQLFLEALKIETV